MPELTAQESLDALNTFVAGLPEGHTTITQEEYTKIHSLYASAYKLYRTSVAADQQTELANKLSAISDKYLSDNPTVTVVAQTAAPDAASTLDSNNDNSSTGSESSASDHEEESEKTPQPTQRRHRAAATAVDGISDHPADSDDRLYAGGGGGGTKKVKTTSAREDTILGETAAIKRVLEEIDNATVADGSKYRPNDEHQNTLVESVQKLRALNLQSEPDQGTLNAMAKAEEYLKEIGNTELNIPTVQHVDPVIVNPVVVGTEAAAGSDDQPIATTTIVPEEAAGPDARSTDDGTPPVVKHSGLLSRDRCIQGLAVAGGTLLLAASLGGTAVWATMVLTNAVANIAALGSVLQTAFAADPVLTAAFGVMLLAGIVLLAVFSSKLCKTNAAIKSVKPANFLESNKPQQTTADNHKAGQGTEATAGGPQTRKEEETAAP